jgi:hypothetical protein
MASECIFYNLEFQNFPGEDPFTPRLPARGGNPSLKLSPTCDCGARFVPLALNSLNQMAQLDV